jgi:putative FmdB family regulatory protein
MPIYEYRCPRCRVLLSVYARTVNPAGTLYCPHCPKTPIERQLSVFAAPRRSGGEAGEDQPSPGGADESRMEQMMQSLASEAEKIGDDNPRDAARLLSRLSAESGLPLGPGLREALARLEAGEDPEQVEADLGAALDADPLPEGDSLVEDRPGSRRKLPFRDPNLYDWADLEKWKPNT